MNESEEEFGEQRLTELVSQNMNLSPEALKNLILSEVQRFVGGSRQHDDLTLVVAKVVL